jgi:hypothetical protein
MQVPVGEDGLIQATFLVRTGRMSEYTDALPVL